MAVTLPADERMGTFDAVMWGVEADPRLRSVIVAMTVLERKPDPVVFRERTERLTRVMSRLRTRVVGNPMSLVPPRWEPDPNFDLDYHLREYAVRDDGTMRPAIRIAEIMANQDFDRSRPLWECALVTGLPDGKCAVLLKLHHSVTDGVGGMQLAANLFDLTAEPRGLDELEPTSEPAEASPLGARQRLMHAVTYETGESLQQAGKLLGVVRDNAGSVVTDPVGSAKGAVEFIGSLLRLTAMEKVPESRVMTGRSMSSYFDYQHYSIEGLKAAAKVAGGRLNDAYLAAVAGGLAEYHRRHGQPVEGLRVNMPINLRTVDDVGMGGNKWVPARYLLPTGIDDPVKRMKAVKKIVAAQRAEPALVMVEQVTGLMNRLPRLVTTELAGAIMLGCDLAASNVPGAPIPIYLAGAKVLELVPFSPRGGAALNFTLLSYCDTAAIGINLDRKAVPDTDVFMDCVRHGFEEILAVADGARAKAAAKEG